MIKKGKMMNIKLILRILSVILSVIALILLGYLWKKGYKEYSFIPLLIVAVALLLSRFSQNK